MVKFKTIKYKHYKRAMELQALIDKDQATDDELLGYTISLVAEWDFVDEETKQPLPISADIMEELSLEQYKQLNGLLNKTFGTEQTVPNASAAPSPSGLTE